MNRWADVETKSADAAETSSAVLSDTDGAVQLVRPTHDIRLRVATHALPDITLGRQEITSSTAWSASCPLFAVCLPISGQIQITTNAATARVAGRSGAVVSPGCPVAVEYLTHDCRMQTLLFEQSALESELSTMIGGPASELQFDFELALTAPPSPFQRALALLENEIAESAGLVAVPAMSTRLARLVIAGLLLSQPNNYTDELTRPSALPGSRAIRRALEFIEGRPSEIDTVADIANEVGLSVRALDDGFQRYVGTPPMSYLRHVRMSRAHDDLVSADPELTTATTIAHRWGFGHYGRFASEYRRRYGRKPSETLRAR